MKRLYYIILVCFMILTAAQAQELTVKPMTVAGNDISASQYERKDLNGKPCALVKVQLAAMGAVFEGNVIGRVDYKTGEYWVYMTEGSKELRIKHPNFVPLAVQFSNYGIKGLESKATYVLTLLMPQGIEPVRLQKLTINYTPIDAIVLIDSKPYQGNGHVDVYLPVGTHAYQVVAMGYETAEGSVKLMAGAPSTVMVPLTITQAGEMSYKQAYVTTQEKTIQQDTSASKTPFDMPALEIMEVLGVSFNMVRVDGGTFTMGATEEQGPISDLLLSRLHKDEYNVHQVNLSTYYMGETEVTQELWQAVMGYNPSFYKNPDSPVEYVSWKDCKEFIKKLNRLTGKKFRLPTEAEWEFAARGGVKSLGYKYSGSNSIDSVAWNQNNSENTTHEVKMKKPNELGLYDMSGNVGEWCEDWYGDYDTTQQTNPKGAKSGKSRILRGGNWSQDVFFCRSSARSGSNPKDKAFPFVFVSDRESWYGFRLALSSL